MRGPDDETARITREITSRAIRRLDLLEWLIFVGAAALAILGGGLLALLLAEPLGFGFRPTWLVASLVLFIVPGTIAVLTLRREEHRRARRLDQLRKERDSDS